MEHCKNHSRNPHDRGAIGEVSDGESAKDPRTSLEGLGASFESLPIAFRIVERAGSLP